MDMDIYTEMGTKRLRDVKSQPGNQQEEKRLRRDGPVQVSTVDKREPSRNFLEVMMRERLDRKPNFTAAMKVEEQPVRTPVTKSAEVGEETGEHPETPHPKMEKRYGCAEQKAFTPR